MKSVNANKINRKSGEAEGSAVRPGSRTKVFVPLVLTQTLQPGRKKLKMLRALAFEAFGFR
jgi:hypothetical protein